MSDKILLEKILFENNQQTDLTEIDFEDIFSAVKTVHKIVYSWKKFDDPDLDYLTTDTFDTRPDLLNFFLDCIEIVDRLARDTEHAIKNAENEIKKRVVLVTLLRELYRIFVKFLSYFRETSSPKRVKFIQSLCKELFYAIRPFIEVIKNLPLLDSGLKLVISSIYESFHSVIRIDLKPAKKYHAGKAFNLKTRAGKILDHINAYINKLVDSDRFTNSDKNKDLISLLRDYTSIIKAAVIRTYFEFPDLADEVNQLLRQLKTLEKSNQKIVSKSFIKTLIELTREVTGIKRFAEEYYVK